MASSTNNITFEIEGVCCGRTTIGFSICYSRHHLCAPFTWRRRTFVGGGIFGIHNFTRTGASKTHEFFQVTVAPTWCCLFFYFILACFNGCFFGVGGTRRGLVQKIASRVRWKDLYVHHVQHNFVKRNKITIFGVNGCTFEVSKKYVTYRNKLWHDQLIIKCWHQIHILLRGPCFVTGWFFNTVALIEASKRRCKN